MTEYKGKFADRTDAAHVLAQLPPVGGPECADPKLVAMAQRWRPGGPQGAFGGLVMLGPTGSGKTTAACHLVRLALARWEWATSTAFILASDLADSEELAEKAKRVRLLVVDDLGKETDYKNRIFRVLDYRHTRQPTIITSGIRPGDLDKTYDGATVRRMFEFRGQKVARVSAFKETIKKSAPDPVGRPRNPRPYSEVS